MVTWLFVSLVYPTVGAADVIRSEVPRTLRLGSVRGPSIHRLDAARTGRGEWSLPQNLKRRWRLALRAHLVVPPAIGPDGVIYVATKRGELWRLKQRADAEEVAPESSRLDWRVRLGSTAYSAPVIAANGAVFVVTRDARAWLIAPDGHVIWSAALGAIADAAKAAPLPLARGGYIVATDTEVIQLGRDGDIRARAVAPEPIRGNVLPAEGGAILTGVLGGVYRFRPPAPLRKLGRVGGRVSGGAILVGPRMLAAVVGGRELVAFDLLRGRSRRLYAAPPGHVLEGPPSFTHAEQLAVTSSSGALAFVGPRGQILRQLALDPAAPPLPSTRPGRRMLRRPRHVVSPALLAGPGGRLAFVRADGRVGVVEQDRITMSADQGCAGGTPLAVLPAAAERILMACRDGTLMVYTEGDAHQP